MSGIVEHGQACLGQPHGGPLTDLAIATLAEVDLTPEQWARANYMPNRWCGDRCGCADNRCIGHHHFDENDCGCLPAMLEQWVAGDPYRWFAVKPPGPTGRRRRLDGYARQHGHDPYRYNTGPDGRPVRREYQPTGRQRRRLRKKFNRTWIP